MRYQSKSKFKSKIKKLLKFAKKHGFLILLCFNIAMASFVAGVFVDQKVVSKKGTLASSSAKNDIDLTKLQEKVLPAKGYTFKIKWGDLGFRMVQDGVIDEKKLAQAVSGQDELPAEFKKYFDNSDQQQIELTQGNAHFWVDVLWGLGLANKSVVLDKGPMVEGGKTANFASTGGWTLGRKQPMQVYSKFSYINLTPEQESIVQEIAGNIYRPCCGNSTAFPDCNHGMAALGLIELMVSQGFSKEDIYKTVLAFNSYWFPKTYLDISYHFTKNGKDYTKVSAQEILSKTFSSAMGYGAIKNQVGTVEWPLLKQSGGGCGA